MSIRSLAFIFSVITLAIAFPGCKKDKPDPDPVPFNNGCYPPEIAEIIVRKCATAGCHNTISKDAASGLDLTTWETMFQGNRNGATTIPYRSDQSTLFYFINTDTTLGVVQLPTMPYNATPLTTAEILTIRNWIDAGAPNCNGEIKFSGNPNRKKFYVANQGCDIVGVHDAVTKVVMRYIDVGNSPAIESPHMIKVSPDGQYWYVAFINSNVLQKYRTSDDTFVAEANITQGAWNTFAMSPDGTKAWVVDFSSTGRVAYVDLVNMELKLLYTDPGFFNNPHGSAVSPDGNTLYVTGQIGNVIYKWDVTNPLAPDYETININNSGGLNADPHELAFSPDGSRYFLSCQTRNEIRVFNSADDSFISAIPTATNPLEMAFSPSKGYLFVSCEGGNAVTVIDYTNLSHVKDIIVGFQPHGLAVDELKSQVYVANRNTPSGGGPAPHHTSACGGRNGYLTIIDMNTLNLVPGFKMELSVDPYSVTVRN
jgi:DNA-binding beta-propeller fold protein YncE